MQWCGSGAAPAGYGAPTGADAEDCEDCVETRVHYRSVQVPCTRNVYRTQKHQVPRRVEKKVPKQVSYTDFEMRSKQEPYTVMRAETRYKNEVQNYQRPVQKTEVITVPVTRKVPKTIYVDQIFQEKKTVQKTVMEPAQRTITVPHTVQVPETKYRDVRYKVPVQKYRTEFETRYDTVYDTVERQVCTPVTKMVTKRIPVTTVHARAAAPCPPGGCPPEEVGGGYTTGATGGGYVTTTTSAQAIVDTHAAMDTNRDGVVDVNEALAFRGYQAGPAVVSGGGGYGASGYSAGGGGYGASGYSTGGRGYSTGGYSTGATGAGGYTTGAAPTGSATAEEKGRTSFGAYAEKPTTDKDAKKK